MVEKQESTVTKIMPEQTTSTRPPALARWLEDLGSDVESLAQMARKPTDVRPFIYEVRLDLIPAKGGQALLVAKGFGADGGLVSFTNSNGMLALLRDFEGRLKSGKAAWYPDKFAAGNYEQRLQLYLSGEYYRT